MVRPGSLKLLMVMTTVFLFTAACSDPGSVENGGQLPPEMSEHRTDAAYDPAMAGRVNEARPSEDGAQVVAPAERAPSVADEPEGLTVDKSGCRVFVPEAGWVGVARFWDIYHREPELLPGSFDHSLLKDIALEGFDGEPGPGLACIGVGDPRE